MLRRQKEVLDAYQEANQAWAARVKMEVDFWSELATKSSEFRTAPEGLEAYRSRISQRMQMAAEDTRHLVEDSQKVMAVVMGSLGNGGSAKSK